MEINRTVCYCCNEPVHNYQYNKIHSGNFTAHLCDKHLEEWNKTYPDELREGEKFTKALVFFIVIILIVLALWQVN